MTDFINSFFLGMLQGLSEFLPVSSSGHLALTQVFFSTDHIFFFTIFVHFGTLIALVIFYRKDWIIILKKSSAPLKTNTFLKITTASIPAALAGVFLYEIIKSIFDQYLFIALGLLFTSILLIGTKWKTAKNKIQSLDQISYRQAFGIGCLQALALIPGISRSGATISWGVYLGLTPRLSATFSFLTATAALIGAFILELSQMNWQNTQKIIPALIGAASSCIFSWFALHLMKSLANHLYKFSFYLIPLGLGVLIYSITL